MTLVAKRRFCYAVLLFGVVNFVAQVGIALWLGGVANSIENGHYFLFDHGRVTEVSRAIFFYSRIHFFSMWLTNAFALIALLILLNLEKTGLARKSL